MEHHHRRRRISRPLATAAVSPAFFTEAQVGDLRQALISTTLELQTTQEAALRLARLLEEATRERDEARLQCHSLLLLLMDHDNHNYILPSNPKPISEPEANLSSEDEENETNSYVVEVEAAAERRGLPEIGRLVEAVMGAGPLLQTLLLAGPLPQWRHPPPAIQTFEIPPVSIPLSDSPSSSPTGNSSM